MEIRENGFQTSGARRHVASSFAFRSGNLRQVKSNEKDDDTDSRLKKWRTSYVLFSVHANFFEVFWLSPIEYRKPEPCHRFSVSVLVVNEVSSISVSPKHICTRRSSSSSALSSVQRIRFAFVRVLKFLLLFPSKKFPSSERFSSRTIRSSTSSSSLTTAEGTKRNDDDDDGAATGENTGKRQIQ